MWMAMIHILITSSSNAKGARLTSSERKSYENSFWSNFYHNDPIMWQFCTFQDSWAVVACTKLCHNLLIIFHAKATCIFWCQIWIMSSQALRNNLVKIYNARNHIYGENFVHVALGTHTMFQLEILIRSMMSQFVIHKFQENILESTQNLSETIPWTKSLCLPTS